MNPDDSYSFPLQEMSMYRNHPYSFDTPIGYRENPLSKETIDDHIIYSREQSRSSTSLSPPPPSNGHTFDKLPIEITTRIANELSQADCLSLLRVCKSFYHSTLPRLYQNIKIDQTYSQFSKEYNYDEFEVIDFNLQQFSCTYIKTPYNLKKFLKTYISMWNHKDQDISEAAAMDSGSPYVKSFSCIDLPDSLNIYDHELNDLFKYFFQTLFQLKDLKWVAKGFEYEYLELLPNYHSIQNLSLNMKYSSYITNSATTSPSTDLSKRKLVFPNLVNFQIDNFQSHTILRDIISNIVISSNSSAGGIASQLKSVKLSRSDSHLNDVYPYDSLVGSELPFKQNEMNTIQSFLVKPSLVNFKEIASLSLHDFLLEPDEADLMVNCINLGNLTSLELTSISEYQQNFDSIDLKPSFLLKIVDKLVNLKNLSIDYRESITDSVPKFLTSLPVSSKLENLDLTIRYNRSKLRTFHNETTLYNEYAQAIFLNGRFDTLKKLSIDIKEENLYCGDINISLPLPSMFYPLIQQCKGLESLRFSPSNVGTQREIIDMIESLKRLEYLDVFGTKAGGAPHLGLEMVHPTVYDEWFKVQHVAMLYVKCNMNLKYVRVNKCVFENLSTEITPRDGINRWFDKHVKMGLT